MTKIVICAHDKVESAIPQLWVRFLGSLSQNLIHDHSISTKKSPIPGIYLKWSLPLPHSAKGPPITYCKIRDHNVVRVELGCNRISGSATDGFESLDEWLPQHVHNTGFKSIHIVLIIPHNEIQTLELRKKHKKPFVVSDVDSGSKESRRIKR